MSKRKFGNLHQDSGQNSKDTYRKTKTNDDALEHDDTQAQAPNPYLAKKGDGSSTEPVSRFAELDDDGSGDFHNDPDLPDFSFMEQEVRNKCMEQSTYNQRTKAAEDLSFPKDMLDKNKNTRPIEKKTNDFMTKKMSSAKYQPFDIKGYIPMVLFTRDQLMEGVRILTRDQDTRSYMEDFLTPYLSFMDTNGDVWGYQKVAGNAVDPLRKLLEAMPNLASATKHVLDWLEESLDVMVSRKLVRMPPLLISGQPGIGKTYWAIQVANILEVPFSKINCGTDSLNMQLLGTNIRYGNSSPGEIAKLLSKVSKDTSGRCYIAANPILVMDEMGRSSGSNFENITATMNALLEPESAISIKDNFVITPLNASQVIYIGTTNNQATMEASLRSRWVTVNPNPLTEEQELAMTRNLIASQIQKRESAAQKGYCFNEDVIHKLSKMSLRDQVRKVDDLLKSLRQSTNIEVSLDMLNAVLPKNPEIHDDQILLTTVELLDASEEYLSQLGDAPISYLETLQEIRKVGLSKKRTMDTQVIQHLQCLRDEIPNFAHVTQYIANHFMAAAKAPKMFKSIQPILLMGPPGVGKSRYAKKLADALCVPHEIITSELYSVIMQLKGAYQPQRDGKDGIGALLRMLSSSRSACPVVVLDEMDKLHVELASWLLPLLEPSTSCNLLNEALQLRFDASHVIWVATANDLEQMSKPLLDRFKVFQIAPMEDRYLEQFVRSKLEEANRELGSKFSITDVAVGRLIQVPMRLLCGIIHEMLSSKIAQGLDDFCFELDYVSAFVPNKKSSLGFL